MAVISKMRVSMADEQQQHNFFEKSLSPEKNET